MMRNRLQPLLLVIGACVAVSVAAFAQTAKPAAPKNAKKARVFFVEPKNGATVTSPVHMKFGSEGIEIAAVPPGEVTTARPGVGHYHLGIEQSCLAPNTTIVKGTPSWVHFGDGKSEIDMQLSPGKHKLALQIGDDLHKTLPGTCSSISITVK
jgi:uncharacterized protein DUF4399/uncharacterized protein DUF6130